MRNGQRQHRVLIQERSEALDSVNQQAEVWLPVMTFACSIEPMSGREIYTSEQEVAGITDRLTGSYNNVIKPTMRGIRGDDVYNIKQVIDPKMKHRTLQLLCERGIRQNG